MNAGTRAGSKVVTIKSLRVLHLTRSTGLALVALLCVGKATSIDQTKTYITASAAVILQ